MPNVEDINVKSSLAEMEKSLGTIAGDTSKIKSFFETSMEEQVEGKRAEKLKGKEEKTQTKLLQGIFKNTKDGKGKGESFLSRHWGKLLLALLAAIAALKIPWKMFNSPSDFADEILNQIDKTKLFSCDFLCHIICSRSYWVQIVLQNNHFMKLNYQ